MRLGLAVSAILHVVIFGGAALAPSRAPKTLPLPPTTEVSMLTEAEFETLFGANEGASTPEASPINPPEPAPRPLAVADVAPEPAPQIPLPIVTQEPTPAPAPRILPTPSLDPSPVAESAPRPKPTPTPTPAPTLIPEPTPAVAPAAAPEAAPEIVTEAETPSGTLQASERPRARPARPAALPSPTPSEQDNPFALDLESLIETPQVQTPQVAGMPRQTLGQGLSASTIGRARRVISGQWNVGRMGTAAQQTIVTVAFELNRDRKLVSGSLALIFSSSSDTIATQAAYDTARSALVRAIARGLDLPAEKYAHWRYWEVTFDAQKGTIY